jgi:hypothetical protein
MLGTHSSPLITHTSYLCPSNIELPIDGTLAVPKIPSLF